MDISKLNEIDLNSIDTGQIIQVFLEKRNLIINIFLVLVTVFVLLGIFNGYHAKETAHQAKIVEIKHKLSVILDLQSKSNEITTFLNSLPKELEEEKVLSEITDRAENSHVEISSFVPGDNKLNEFDELRFVKMTVVARDFKSMGTFLKSLESSPYLMRLDGWIGTIFDQGNSDNKGQINGEVQVVSLRIIK